MPTYVNNTLRKDLEEISKDLLGTVNAAAEKFKGISEKEWSTPTSEGAWCKKEILGHLLVSASNNHIRFVRIQLVTNDFTGLSYEQDFFVSSQKYKDRSASELIELWVSFNRHLAHVIKHIDPSKLNVICKIGNSEPVPFLFVIEDYLGHLKHHLKQTI
ncbi:MAG TPA: DinB family protein [Bacteroidia bacterium]|jgi:hypothetical protein|nr:DinB family protein [Bacteroidia bacterium]